MHRFLRFYSSQAAASKSLLASLRRKTGFPIGKCKEALTQHDNDLEAAEKWLHARAQEEGWAKAQKLQGRNAQQGLIGVIVRDNKAAMVEVNCETDFVARNDRFQSLVSAITQATLEHKAPKPLISTDLPSIHNLTKEIIAGISLDGYRSLADVVAENVGHLAENLVISRGCTMTATEGLICSYTYNNTCPPDAPVAMGTYAALVHLLPSGEDFDPTRAMVLGRQICQHVIGANPLAVDAGNGEDEALMEQSFVLDDSVSVGDLLRKNSARVTCFVRYSLGTQNH